MSVQSTGIQGTFVPLSADEKEEVKKAMQPVLMNFANNIIELNKKISEAQQNAEEAQREIEEADRTIEESDRKIQAGLRIQRESLTKLFFSIFYGSKQAVPADQMDELFNTYLADRSISYEEGKRCFKINSMKNIVNYLVAHADVKQCDFRTFKSEVNDISTLAEHLKNSTVKAIAINNGISAEARTKLEDAVTSRKGGLKVQYFG